MAVMFSKNQTWDTNSGTMVICFATGWPRAAWQSILGQGTEPWVTPDVFIEVWLLNSRTETKKKNACMNVCEWDMLYNSPLNAHVEKESAMQEQDEF